VTIAIGRKCLIIVQKDLSVGNNKIIILNINNLNFISSRLIDFVYADMIYDNVDFTWIHYYWRQLKENGIFIVQTDYHTVANVKLEMDKLSKSNFVNWVIYKQEWGGCPRRGFSQKHDDILIYSKGKNFKWYGDRIQIPKVTAGTKLDRKGTGLKTPCSVFDDLGNFSTLSKERIKDVDTGKCIQWQKPIKLLQRLMRPFLDAGDLVLDPFCGTATSGVVAKELGCDYIGIELDKKIYGIAKNRLGC